MGFRQFVSSLALWALAVLAQDETCDANVEGGILELYELMGQGGCQAEAAVAKMQEMYKRSTSMHESHYHLAKVEQEGNWTEHCTLCVQKDSCHLPHDTTQCHSHPDFHFLQSKASDISAKNFWDDAKCTSCKGGMMLLGGGIQIALDATPEGVAEVGIIGGLGLTLKLAAEREGKDLILMALQNQIMKNALIGIAATVATITLHMHLVQGLDYEESKDCIFAIIVDALPLIITTAGQAIIPTVLGALADMSCCTSSIKDSCNKRKRLRPIPPPSPPPEPPKKEERVRVVVRYEEAQLDGQNRGVRMSEEERDTKQDLELWTEAEENYGGIQKKAELSAMTSRGEACASNPAIKEARGEEQIKEQDTFLKDWKDCQCLYMCQTWINVPYGLPQYGEDCHKRVFNMGESAPGPVCPGAWWRSLQPREKCAITPPRMYNREGSELKADQYPKIQVPATMGVKAVVSFGGRTGPFLRFKVPPEVNVDDIGFMRAKLVKDKLPGMLGLDAEKGAHLVYIDKFELAQLEGGYMNGDRTMNCYWASYYKSAMAQSKLMVFLVDQAWLDSPFCAQELYWAIGWEDPAPSREAVSKPIVLPGRAYEEWPGEQKFPGRIHLFASMDEDYPFGAAGGCEDGQLRLRSGCIRLPENHVLTRCPYTKFHHSDLEKQLEDCVFGKIKELMSGENPRLVF